MKTEKNRHGKIMNIFYADECPNSQIAFALHDNFFSCAASSFRSLKVFNPKTQ